MQELLLLALLSGVVPASAAPSPGAASADTVPLFEGLGDHHHSISTTNTEAQAYFDQGLRLVYGFNHAEAIRSFEEALRMEGGCAMCWWGIALAAGPNINAAMDSAGGALAWKAIQAARKRGTGASAKEEAYIEALSRRYGPDPLADRAQRDSAYAIAMAEVARRFPADDDAQVLYADALMNLAPWDYWEADLTPRPGTSELLSTLARVVERAPAHAGACHLFIHAVEKGDPQRAVPCAERLPDLMPSAGHIVHMPAHIFIRVGRYIDAIERNHHATHADERYIHAERPRGIYPMAYYPHNYDFLAFAAAMAGRRGEALEAARAAVAAVDREMATVPELGGLQNYQVLPLRMMVRFGLWAEVLAEPAPPPDQRFAVGFHHFARGLSLLRTGRVADAVAELQRLRTLSGEPEVQPVVIWWNPAAKVLRLAELVLEAEIAQEGGRSDQAVALLEDAVALEDGLVYDEPPAWSVPPRQVLGRVLLECGRPAAAEQVFRADLERHPENGWSLLGLTQALAAQGRDAEAKAARARLERAWRTADGEVKTSAY
ncbi:MAG: hypothetical protein R3E10_18275 [Gemmatimonadota bacterium]